LAVTFTPCIVLDFGDMSEVEELKGRQAQVWGLGDYTVLARRFEPAAVALCDACAVSAGQEVLDLGAGTGNFAAACAREGASVVASDLSPGMVERGRARTQAEGLDVEWLEADVEDLPFEDDRFDCVGSVFGAFIAPRPDVAAAEMFRVVRPGGAVGLTAWTADGFFGELSALGQRFNPTPPGLGRPQEWGDEGTARSRLEGLAAHVEIERGAISFTTESPEALAAEFADNAPPYAAARAGLPAEQFEELVSATEELARRWGEGGDGGLRVEAGYLIVVARKRG
jgi:ubiquinone/menaquinone biosynthesis C-methylase UbiE